MFTRTYRMQKREILPGLLMAIAAGTFASWWFDGLSGWLEFLTATGTVGAVIVALFHDEIRDQMYPLGADMRLVRNNGVWEETPETYVYHLRIINTSHGRPLEGAHVVLTGLKLGDEPEELVPVERIMRWAPGESREMAVTLHAERTLDFGRFVDSRTDAAFERVFNIDLYEFYRPHLGARGEFLPQGGYLRSWVNSKETVRYRLEVRAQDFKKVFFVHVYWSGEIVSPPKSMAEHLRINVSPAC